MTVGELLKIIEPLDPATPIRVEVDANIEAGLVGATLMAGFETPGSFVLLGVTEVYRDDR